jgi:hypothetical protein
MGIISLAHAIYRNSRSLHSLTTVERGGPHEQGIEAVATRVAPNDATETKRFVDEEA